jgi:hypothetical protein
MNSFGTDFVDAVATAIALARRRRHVPLTPRHGARR